MKENIKKEKHFEKLNSDSKIKRPYSLDLKNRSILNELSNFSKTISPDDYLKPNISIKPEAEALKVKTSNTQKIEVIDLMADEDMDDNNNYKTKENKKVTQIYYEEKPKDYEDFKDFSNIKSINEVVANKIKKSLDVSGIMNKENDNSSNSNRKSQTHLSNEMQKYYESKNNLLKCEKCNKELDETSQQFCKHCNYKKGSSVKQKKCTNCHKYNLISRFACYSCNFNKMTNTPQVKCDKCKKNNLFSNNNCYNCRSLSKGKRFSLDNMYNMKNNNNNFKNKSINTKKKDDFVSFMNKCTRILSKIKPNSISINDEKTQSEISRFNYNLKTFLEQIPYVNSNEIDKFIKKN